MPPVKNIISCTVVGAELAEALVISMENLIDVFLHFAAGLSQFELGLEDYCAAAVSLQERRNREISKEYFVFNTFGPEPLYQTCRLRT